MNVRKIPSEDPGAGLEDYDHHEVYQDEYAPGTYAQQYRLLASYAIDPETRKAYQDLAEMFE